MRIWLLLWLVLILAQTNPFSIGRILVSGQCLGDQKSLLLELKKSLNFTASLSSKLVRWNQSNDSWDGVKCEGGQVTGLDLSNESIAGGLNDSSSLFRLKYLRRLNLAFNRFQSLEIPSGFSNLTNLVHLNLSNAGFTGQVPIGISRLTRLVTLDVSMLYFPGLTSLKLENPNLKMLVGNLIELRELYLDGVNVSATGNELCNALSSSLPKLQVLSMTNCYLSGPIKSCSSLVNLGFLSVINLSGNNIGGELPEFIWEFRGLKYLSLSSNKFSGSFHINLVQQLRDLSYLDLSYNSFSIYATNTASQASSLPNLTTLKLASCQLTTLPEFLAKQHRLIYLDLSRNWIRGKIPQWIWGLQNLMYLNLSSNLLDDIETLSPNITPTLTVLDLHNNRLRGQTLPLPPFATFMDFSSNDFALDIPPAIGTSLLVAIFFSLSKNNFQGSIPKSICRAEYLKVLDLSHNNLTGNIPDCLVMGSLKVLNLRDNALNGSIINFPETCGLKTLDFSTNQLQGQFPESLANCTTLEVLDIRNNQIDDVYPCQLKSIASLRVLVLRSNKFHGRVGCPGTNGTWKMLQIVDISFNNFSGALPSKSLTDWEAMKANVDMNHTQYPFLPFSGIYYQDTVSVTIKGLQLELVKILTLFTSIDFSCNNFEGPIPDTLGDLKALYFLNLSKNGFSGPIPPSLANLQQLESLDLSRNDLNGMIPPQLSNLNFLSFLNLSYNKLEGSIPAVKQFLNFSKDSFEGNGRLCGFPLHTKCSDPDSNGTDPSDSFEGNASDSDDSEEWFYVGILFGFVVGFWIFCGPLASINSWRFAYYRF